ncbi:MAG: IS1595 family transposase [Acidobacteriota bacterium]|nr:IS1595 family transposase [Acidobacteriota bacterium]
MGTAPGFFALAAGLPGSDQFTGLGKSTDATWGTGWIGHGNLDSNVPEVADKFIGASSERYVYLMTDKQGISAMALRKHLGCHYDTAYRLLMLLRGAMADRDQSYTLSGITQVDEAYVGGHGDGRHRRGRARDTKRVIGVAVEQVSSNVSGFIPLEVLPAADAESLHGMVLEKIRPGTRLLTDEWPS